MSDPAPKPRRPLDAVPPLPCAAAGGPASVANPHDADKSTAPAALTPEEQMEKFAQDLKENDWGHQPC